MGGMKEDEFWKIFFIVVLTGAISFILLPVMLYFLR